MLFVRRIISLLHFYFVAVAQKEAHSQELTTIGVRPTVCHAQDPSPCVLQRRADLVLELVSVDRAAASSCASRVAGL